MKHNQECMYSTLRYPYKVRSKASAVMCIRVFIILRNEKNISRSCIQLYFFYQKNILKIFNFLVLIDYTNLHWPSRFICLVYFRHRNTYCMQRVAPIIFVIFFNFCIMFGNACYRRMLFVTRISYFN